MITPKIPLCHSDSCECGVTYTSGSALQQLCVGTVTSPCSCSLTTPISETFRCEVRGSEHVPWRDGGDGGVMGGEVQKDRLNPSSPTPSLSIPPPLPVQQPPLHWPLWWFTLHPGLRSRWFSQRSSRVLCRGGGCPVLHHRLLPDHLRQWE